MRRIGAVLACSLASAVALAACGPDEGDYQRTAEQTITERLRHDLGVDSEVACEAPADTDRGTTFACSAKAADGARYDFVAEIADDGVTVTAANG